jgi:protein-L-isoaspartate O-methyltransferase
MDRQGSGDIWISREHHEAIVPEALLPNLIQGGGMIMVWGAVWHGGRSQLVRFDCSESTGERGGVTAVIY